MPEFKLPDPGEGLQEAEIVRWLVAVGDVVAVNDVLVEIETAKSLVELPSPYAGVVSELLVAEGDVVEVGSPIIRIGEETLRQAQGTEQQLAEPVEASDVTLRQAQGTGGSTQGTGGSTQGAEQQVAEPVEAQGQVAEPVEAQGAAATNAMLVGYGAKAGAISRRARRGGAAVAVPETDQVHESYDTANPVSRRTDEVTPSDRLDAVASGEHLPPPGRPSAGAKAGRRPLATPAVRRVARDLGVDLNQLIGTGAGGLITAEDVVAAASGGLPGRDRRVPLRGIRRAMFNSMTASLQIPQATAMIEADVTGTVEMLELLKTRREFTGLRVSPLLVFAKAACLAMTRIPEINSSYDAEVGEIILHGSVNLGIAAATPRGLLVPNIKNAERMNLVELTEALNAMVAAAREGRVQPYDLADGTFTITNIGVFGVDGGTPILSPGESAIMCLGTIRRKPWVVGTGADEHLEPRSVCTVSLTFDHRLIDGAMASKFLAEVATIMSNPGLALLF
ncbi:MAG: 2-oxo acid dehydrogenase subunit E2 [Actinobacteria bacterium]|nr:2-oxo acid dehydrogenase subunit E2 [Actinomycetota bacterium]